VRLTSNTWVIEKSTAYQRSPVLLHGEITVNGFDFHPFPAQI
jgi:hypothetical protein